MKKIFFLLLSVSAFTSFGQSKTTNDLEKKYDAQSFYFYNNTLRMLNQTENPEFDEIIKDIEKMKFLMIKKTNDLNYQNIVKNYKGESFEEAMTSRHEGKSFDVYLKGTEKKTTGMLVLINDNENLMVLDIVGSIALNKIASLYKTMDESADFGKKIKAFTGGDD